MVIEFKKIKKYILFSLIILGFGFFVHFVLGWDFRPKISTLIGDFYPKKEIDNNSIVDGSNKKILKGSIFDVISKINRLETTLDKQDFYKKYVGLEVQEEGFIHDISKSDIYYDVTIIKNTDNDFLPDFILCEFDEKYGQQLTTMDLKNKISFSGIFSDHYLGPGTLLLKNCQIK